jgi:chromosomal replication initiation ATPase DnaA
MEQISFSQEHFKFEPISSNAEKYFVIHSGVFESYQKVLTITENFLGGIFYIYGPKGSGKSHLCEILIDRCLEFKIPSYYYRIDENGLIRTPGDDIVEASSFISQFQEMKALKAWLL